MDLQKELCYNIYNITIYRHFGYYKMSKEKGYFGGLNEEI